MPEVATLFYNLVRELLETQRDIEAKSLDRSLPPHRRVRPSEHRFDIANSKHGATAWASPFRAGADISSLSAALWSAPDAVTDLADCDPNKPNRRADATQDRRFFEPLPIRQRRFRFGVFRHGF
jgi:hypothetical protein